jgi:hypothetical protein
MNETGIYVQYRSYLNYRLSADVPSVVFLSFGEIASARLVKECVKTPDPANSGSLIQYLRHVELELSGNTAPLAEALQAERGEHALREKRWYGTSSTLYRDYPVRMIAPKFIRIRWDVVPGAHKFLDALRPYTVIADPVSLTQDFTRLKSLSRDDQQKRLLELRPGRSYHRHVRRSTTLRRQLSRSQADGEFSTQRSGAPVAFFGSGFPALRVHLAVAEEPKERVRG